MSAMPDTNSSTGSTGSTRSTRDSRITQTAALLGLTLARDPRFATWYDGDDWGGMVGLTDYLDQLATGLEDQTNGQMKLGEGIDWYLTVDQIVNALLTNYDHVDATDLTRLFYHWKD